MTSNDRVETGRKEKSLFFQGILILSLLSTQRPSPLGDLNSLDRVENAKEKKKRRVRSGSRTPDSPILFFHSTTRPTGLCFDEEVKKWTLLQQRDSDLHITVVGLFSFLFLRNQFPFHFLVIFQSFSCPFIMIITFISHDHLISFSFNQFKQFWVKRGFVSLFILYRKKTIETIEIE